VCALFQTIHDKRRAVGSGAITRAPEASPTDVIVSFSTNARYSETALTPNSHDGAEMNGKRRDVLTAAASAVAVSTPPHGAAAQPATGAGETHPVGDFILRHAGGNLSVSHRRRPDRLLWENAPDGNFIAAEKATADIREFGTPEGSYEITDAVAAIYDRPTIDAIDLAPDRATVSGRLTGPSGSRVQARLRGRLREPPALRRRRRRTRRLRHQSHPPAARVHQGRSCQRHRKFGACAGVKLERGAERVGSSD
jgi:hypothetical protein